MGKREQHGPFLIAWEPDTPTPEKMMPAIDEVVVENASVHIERMTDSSYWIGIDSGGHSWRFFVGSRSGCGFVDLRGEDDTLVDAERAAALSDLAAIDADLI